MCKCAYKHCLYVSPEIKPEDVVTRGSKYYHKKCLDTLDTIKEIIDTYYNNVSQTAVMKVLMSVVNNIVFTKQIDCHYLLFALKQAIAQKRTIKAPVALYYLIDDYKIKKQWESVLGRKIMREAQEQSEVDPTSAPSFKQSNNKPAGFDTIFGG